MSGIGDGGDNSDLQRIREVNQAELKRRVQQQKRGQQARVEKSFKEVMAERGREKMAQQAQRQAPLNTTANPRDPAAQRLMAQVRSQARAEHGNLAQKAAMSSSMAGGMVKGRAKGHRTDALQSEARAEQLLTQATDELDHVSETAREDDARDLMSSEEKQAEIQAEARGDDPIQRDGRRQQQHQRDGGGQDDGQKTEGVQASDGPRAAHRVNIPPALIQQIVRAVMKSVGPDGRTEMQIHLRGGPLDGVKLDIKTNDGQVQCTFHGCNREMENLLKGGRKMLADGLSKRGLKLTALTVA